MIWRNEWIFYVLRNLDEDETTRYVQHRLSVAGAKYAIFNDEANSLIFNSSSGRPRQINNICDMALLVGYMRKADLIDGKIIREVVRDLGDEI